nr:sensor histidine kinase [Natronomonas gomsonensis]
MTARHEVEERLREETETLERLLETSPIGITVLDADGQIVRANAMAEEVLGLERSDAVGRTFDEPNWGIVGEKGEPVDIEDLPFSHVMATGKSVRGYEHGITEGGETRWLSVNAEPLTDESGERIGVITTVEDITEQRAQERELERLVDLLNQMQDIADIGGWEIDTDEGEAEFTKGLAQLLGVWPRTEFDLDEAFGFFHPADEAEARDVFGRVVATGKPQELDCRIQTVSGETRWIHVRGQPHQSEPSVYRGTIQDITERRERGQELKETKDLLQSVFDASPIGILAVDEDGITQLWSMGCERIFGWSEKEAVGEPLPNVQEEKQAEFDELRTEVIEDKQPVIGYETVRQRKDGSLVDVTLTTAPMRDSDGEVIGVVGLLEDITDRKERERRLSVFDRVLRHNLRNKMNVIQGWSELLIDDPTSEETADAAAKIQESSDELLKLSKLVRDFETVSDPGASDLVETVDVARHVEEIVSESKLSYPSASLSVETPSVAEAKVHPAFELAVNELIDNAVKHSGEQPSVHLSVTIDDESDAVVFRVADDGPGIPDLERRSVTAGQESPLQHSNGLGLWFVRWMATNSGGSMRIEDNEPTGAVVELRFLRQ